MTPPSKKPPGMTLRRPGERTAPDPPPSDDAIRALELRAEEVASKTPGAPVAHGMPTPPAPVPTESPPEPPTPQPPSPADSTPNQRAPHGPVASRPASAAPTTPEVQPAPAASSRKVQVSAYLTPEIKDELRRAAVALAGPPHMETVTSIIERGVQRELDRLRKLHGPFPDTATRPRPGRRAG